MRILFAGTPAIAVEVLSGLVDSGHEVVGVLTREQAPVGRKKILTESPVASRAIELGIPVVEANRISSGALEIIKGFKADLAVVVAYGVILNKETLEAIPRGWFNLHFSALPKWRGAAPVQRAIQAGDDETGVTLFKLDEGMDTGPIVAIAPAIIHPNETSADLLGRLTKVGISLLNAELPGIYAETTFYQPQVGEPTYATKPSRQDAKINFTGSATQVNNLVRAMNSEPMAWCEIGSDQLRVIQSQVYLGSVSTQMNTGEVSKVDGRVVVACGNLTYLELLQVQPSSKNPMSAKDWLNGKTGQVVLS